MAVSTEKTEHEPSRLPASRNRSGEYLSWTYFSIPEPALTIASIRQKSLRPPSLLNAHREGYTKTEYGRLSQPLPIWSPRRLYYPGSSCK